MNTAAEKAALPEDFHAYFIVERMSAAHFGDCYEDLFFARHPELIFQSAQAMSDCFHCCPLCDSSGSTLAAETK